MNGKAGFGLLMVAQVVGDNVSLESTRSSPSGCISGSFFEAVSNSRRSSLFFVIWEEFVDVSADIFSARFRDRE